MKTVGIGLVGLGKVGTGVARILTEQRAALRKKAGVNLRLRSVCDINAEAFRRIALRGVTTTSRFEEILKDEDVAVVVELVGGTRAAKRLVLGAIERGKDVVTANKALIAECGAEILGAARRARVSVCFEASVAGGIPIIQALRDGLVANKIQEVLGIVNGTCNYILTEMSDEYASYEEALGQAQEKGYAERNPKLDVGGYDSVHKLAILARLAFGVEVHPSDIYREGIQSLTTADIGYAREFGYVVKLLAIAKLVGGNLELRVHPTALPDEHPLASVKGSFNAIAVTGHAVGQTMFYGQGAGQMPTASAVVSDIVDAALGRARVTFSRFGAFAEDLSRAQAVPLEEIETRYLLRLSAVDKPGVLAKVSGILGRMDISIASVIQKGRSVVGTVPIVMLTHRAREGRLRKALDQVNRLAVVKGKTVVLRVEDPRE